MKVSYTKNTESDFFINNPNLTQKILAVGRGGGGVSDFFFYFFKRIQV